MPCARNVTLINKGGVVSMKGYFGIGIWHGKTGVNVGTLIRSAYSFGADFVFTIGKRYKKQSSALKLDKHVPVLHFQDIAQWKKAMPANARLVCIELHDKAIPVKDFVHPERAIYLLGAEDHGLTEELMNGCQIVQLPGKRCLNVATAGSIIMYDRIMKGYP
jgi:tRNA G18 (ribose-2'-O)-methylase SpoU